MKKHTTLLFAFASILAAFSLQAQPPIRVMSGVYSYGQDTEAGPCGQIVISKDSQGRVRFSGEAVTATGNIASLTCEEWQTVKDNKFTYREDLGDGNYYEVTMEFGPNTLTVEDDLSHGGFGLFGMGACLSGEYRYENGYCGEDGILYYLRSEGYKAKVMRSVFHGKDLHIPSTINCFGDDAKVDLVEPFAFRFEDIESITYAGKDIYIGKGAYMNTPLDKGKSAALPVFAFCDETRTSYVHPVEPEFWKDGREHEVLDAKWVIFKQNLHQVSEVKFRETSENKVGIVIPSQINQVSGVECRLLIDDEGEFGLEKTMFRGYQPYEIVVLLAGNDYVASHDFINYSRWKYPEEERTYSKEFEDKMSRYFGRKVSSSRYVANPRDNDRQILILLNFEITNDKCMYALVWTDGGEVVASYTEEAAVLHFEGEPDASPWGVDAEMDFPIPDVISIARDSNGDLDIFLNSNAPEHAEGFILRQNGNKFEKVEANQWYRYID